MRSMFSSEAEKIHDVELSQLRDVQSNPYIVDQEASSHSGDHEEDPPDLFTGERKATLLGGAQARVERVSKESIVVGVRFSFDDEVPKSPESKTTDDEDADGPENHAVVEENLLEGEIMKRSLIEQLEAIFRAYGKDVFMLRKIGEDNSEGLEAEEGIDPRQIGNEVNLDAAIFVIDASDGEKMAALFENPPAVSGLDMAGNFDIEPWNYLHNDGFVVRYRLPDSDKIAEMRFLYQQDENVRSLEAFRTLKRKE